MNMSSIFDINRTKSLIIRQLCFNTNGFLIGFGAVIGILVFIISLTLIFGHVTLTSGAFFGSVMPTLFIMGYIATSTIYNELRTPQRGYLFLMLPASTFEKLLVPWLISSLIYILASIAAMLVINLLLICVSFLFGTNPVEVFNPFVLSQLKLYAIYLVTQPVFILGAIYFKRFHFLKTILTIFVFTFIVSMFTVFVVNLAVFHGFHGSINISNGELPDNIQNFFSHKFVPIVKTIYWYVLPPFFLIVSYLRLQEREV